jgi:hypothetical protein
MVGDATKTFDVLAGGTVGSGKGAGYYQITAKAATGSIFAVLNVGDLYYNTGAAIMAAGDKSSPVTITRQVDVSDWKIDITADEIRVDPLNSEYKQYRTGKKDASGQMSGGVILPYTTAVGWIMNKFIRKVKFGANNAVTVADVDSTPIMFVGYLQEDTSSGETEVFVVAKISVSTFNVGAADGNKQAFDSKFRLKSDLTQYERSIA